MTFQDFNFKSQLQKAIDEAGFKEPSPIQQKAIPVILNKKDVVAQAQTGTGKTAAFGLPILNMIDNSKVDALIITPTRELAMQVSDEIFRFGKYLNIHTATVYGGQSYSRQIKHINSSAVIVATPGRLLDLLKGNKISISPRFVILDEADEMLDMGFLDDIKEIFSYLPENRQTLLFSATMPEPIKKLAKDILKQPEFITITKKEVTNENITQYYYVVDEHERDDALIRLLDYKAPQKAIIFCRMKKEVDRVSTLLISQGYLAKGLHGDMEQRQREEVIKAFKNSTIEILVATDVAARGLDVSDVTHVFNYHIPFDTESYVHRIGRTGRAGKTGEAISLITPSEFKSLIKIEKVTKTKLIPNIIPTLDDVQKKHNNKLIKKILNTEINENAYDLIEELKEELDLSTIAYKLATLVLSSKKIKGKNKIGKSIKELEKIKKFEENNKPKKRFRRRRR